MKPFTVLKVFSILYIVSCLIYTVIKWKTLSNGEGWGVVYVFGLISFGLIGLLMDFILLKTIKNKWLLNSIELVIVVIFSMELWIEIN